jgi:DNA-binding beta-propeller fold protein YncE
MIYRLDTRSNELKKELFDLSVDVTDIGPVKFSPDGALAYALTLDGGWWGIRYNPGLVIINSSTLKVDVIKDFASRGLDYLINQRDLDISPDGKRLYLLYPCRDLSPRAPSSRIFVYNPENRTCERTIFPGAENVGKIIVSPDGSRIYTANYHHIFPREFSSISIISTLRAAR